MAILIIMGNTNRFTFANSIVTANWKAQQIFGTPLEDIFVLHSSQSYELLHSKSNDHQNDQEDWVDHLRRYNIDVKILTHRILEIEPNADSVIRFSNFIEIILKGLPDSPQVLVDLTNGTTLHKTSLSIIAYILDLKNLYMIDTVKLSQLTQGRGFLFLELLQQCYIPAPENTHLDNIAYLNLVEIMRYRSETQKLSDKYAAIDLNYTDPEFFEDNLIHSIQLKLRGDYTRQRDNSQQQRDKAVYRIASSALSASIEDLIRVLVEKFALGDVKRRTFGQILDFINKKLEKDAPSNFDVEFLRRFNDFMLYLRNSTTHKGRLLTEVEKFKAELAVKMAFPYIEFYTDIVHDVLANPTERSNPLQIRHLEADENITGPMYYGLDGDNTGTDLEELFQNNSDESELRKLSNSIKKGVDKISKFIRHNEPKGTIIFEAGDNLLFKGIYSRTALQNMQKFYQEESGLTCSIGYGKSIREVYIALKLAKTEPGKNAIVGIELQ